MYQRAELFSALKEEDISSTLCACTLPDKQEYTESEADRFRECLDLIGQGKSYKQVAAHFRQIDKTSKLQNGQDEVNTTEAMLEISELLALASQQCGTRISLKEAAVILDSCGLPDTDFYSSEDSGRFLEACDLIKKQNKSYEEVAEHFGVGNLSKTRVNSPQQLLKLLGDSTIVVDENLMDLVNKITAKQANGVNLHKLVRQSYFMNLSHQMSENQDDTDTFFAELESRLMDYIEGKSRARSLGTTWEWAPHSLPPSSTKLIGLPEESNNGTSGE